MMIDTTSDYCCDISIWIFNGHTHTSTKFFNEKCAILKLRDVHFEAPHFILNRIAVYGGFIKFSWEDFTDSCFNKYIGFHCWFYAVFTA